MIKKIIGFALVFISSFAFADGDSDKVPVTLISSVLSGEYGGMEFEIGYQSQGVTKFITIGMGNWRVDTKKYSDVVDAIDDIADIPKIIRAQLLYDARFYSDYPEDDTLFQYDDIAVEAVLATIMSQNNSVVNQALISKYSKISSMSSSEEQANEISELKSASDKYRTSISSLEKNFENVIKTTDDKIQGLSRRMEGLVNEMKSANEDRVKEIQYLMSGFSKLNGLYMTLESKVKENFKPIYVGGSIDALPSSIVSFSNAMDTVSSYLGYKGNEKDGYLKLPDIPEGFFFSEQGDGDDDGNGEVGDGKFKSLIDYLYAAGFMPFLPPQLEGEQKISGTQSSFGRYFSFEKKEGTDENGGNSVVLHAHGVPMPEEWSAAKPWTYNPESGQWVNAYVQIGYETIKYDGLTAIEGDNYLKVNVDTKSVSIEGSSGSQTQNVYYFAIGTISGGKQTSGAYYTPIIFLYQ